MYPALTHFAKPSCRCSSQKKSASQARFSRAPCRDGSYGGPSVAWRNTAPSPQTMSIPSSQPVNRDTVLRSLEPRQQLIAWLPAGLLAVSSAAFGQAAFDGHVKVGVLNDQSSLYADATGQGSVVAARMALEDYMKANPNSKLQGRDHLRRPPEQAGHRRQHRAPVVRARGRRHDSRRAELRGRAGGERCGAATQQGDGQRLGAAPPGSPATSAARTRCIGRSTTTRSPTAPAARWLRPAATPGSSSPPTTRSATLSRRDHRGRQGDRRQGAGQRARAAEYRRLLLLPAAGAGLQGQGHRPRQCRRRHHQLDQAGVRIRHRQGRPEASPACWCSSPTSTRSGSTSTQGLQFTEAFYWDMNDDRRSTLRTSRRQSMWDCLTCRQADCCLLRST